MKISEWLDKKEAEGIDVYQITLPDSLSYDEVPDETIFLRRLIIKELFLQPNIRFLLQSALDTGIMAGGATKQQVFTRQGWSGSCLQR